MLPLEQIAKWQQANVDNSISERPGQVASCSDLDHSTEQELGLQ